MKKLLYTLLILTFTFIGCSESGSILAPQEIKTEKRFLELPKAEKLSIESQFTTEKRITGNLGGEVSLFGQYLSQNGEVSVSVLANFPQRSFLGNKNITITANTNEAVVDFGPSMNFLIPITVNITFTGINLNNLNINEINFYYIDENGNFELVENQGIVVNISTGTVTVVNAKISHFSRYGFAT